jgi:hypothetical protein
MGHHIADCVGSNLFGLANWTLLGDSNLLLWFDSSF